MFLNRFSFLSLVGRIFVVIILLSSELFCLSTVVDLSIVNHDVSTNNLQVSYEEPTPLSDGGAILPLPPIAEFHSFNDPSSSTQEAALSTSVTSHLDIEPESFPYQLRDRTADGDKDTSSGKVEGFAKGVDAPSSDSKVDNESESLCNLSLEILYVQDLTNSMEHVVKQLPSILSSADAKLKLLFNETYFGIGSFKDKPIKEVRDDKPIQEVGDVEDYCFKLDFPMSSTPLVDRLLDRLLQSVDEKSKDGNVNSTDSTDKLSSAALESVFAVNGEGNRVGVFDSSQVGEVMVRAALVGSYTSVDQLSSEGHPVLRLLLFSTFSSEQSARKTQQDRMTFKNRINTPVELSDMFDSALFNSVPKEEPQFEIDTSAGCETSRHPSLYQVRDVLAAQMVHPVFLSSTPTNSPSGLTSTTTARQRRWWKEPSNEPDYEVERGVVDNKEEEVEKVERVVTAVSNAVQKWRQKTCNDARPLVIALERSMASSTISDTTEQQSDNQSTLVDDEQEPEDQSHYVAHIVAVGSGSALVAFLVLSFGLLARRKREKPDILLQGPECPCSSQPNPTITESELDRNVSEPVSPSAYA